MFQSNIGFDDVAVRLALAAIFGAIIGIDREWRNKPAGLRTHMMVALAAGTFTVITLELFEGISRGEAKHVASDPLRLVEGITAGVAFLGAGAIIQSRGEVAGITTGSGIWLAGAVGYAAGAGYYVMAAIACAFAVIILTMLGWVSSKIAKEGAERGAADKAKPKPAASEKS